MPSWEAISPIPTPSSAIDQAKLELSSSGSIVAMSRTAAAMLVARPARTMDRIGKRAGQPRPRRRGQEHRDGDGEHLEAGLQGIEPDHQLQVERNREEDAHQDQVLAEQADQAGAQRGDLQQRQVQQRVASAALAAALPRRERPQQHRPEPDDEDRQREAERRHRGVLLRLDPAPGARLEHSEDDQAQAGGGQDGAHEVELRSRAGPHGVRDLRRHDEDQGHQDAPRRRR